MRIKGYTNEGKHINHSSSFVANFREYGLQNVDIDMK